MACLSLITMTLNFPTQVFGNIFIHIFEKFGDLKAFVSATSEEFYTFRDIKEASLRLAKELKKYFQDGGEEVSTVAIILPNCIEYPIIVHAAMAIGIPICSLRHDFQTDMLLNMLKDVNPKVLITDSTLLKTSKRIFEELPELKVLVKGPKGSESFGTNLHSLLFSNEDAMDIEDAKSVDPESLAFVSFSSGTTGRPKAIMISHRSMVNNVINTMQNPFSPLRSFQDGQQEKLLGNLPFAHMYCSGLYFYNGLMTGCCIYVIDFADAAELVMLTSKFKLTAVTIRPYMIEAVLKEENIKERLKTARVMEHSEVSAVILTPVNQERVGSTGKLIPNVKAKIIDVNSGKPILKPFQEGELLIKSPSLMKGYLNNPEATKEAVEDGWYKTGDIVYYDEDKYFYVVERFKDLINFRGKKVSPSNVENIVKKHPSVQDVGVIGVSGEATDGEVPRAFVVVKNSVSEQELIDFVKTNTSEEELWLRGGVQFLNSLPRTHLGKIQRKYLRDMGWTGSSSFKS
ncbi:Luciferin 4-monooxygenase [Armadillidium nasatum]|uniref:Luciferin 4-monooxygenase n=1 Tax=Armadillidium nasatum TaxID=96803 RepID=A0A5N5SRM4_9CRUS|nr:Luciferin 4-monooxygenase [Armadillidium nasatum]